MSPVFVEHDMDVVMGISDWVVCLAQGRGHRRRAALVDRPNPEVVDAYLGRRRGEPD